MKLLTVLLISIAALACTEVTADPIQISNNNIGDITSVKIDINGKITSVINQVGSFIVSGGNVRTCMGKQQLNMWKKCTEGFVLFFGVILKV